MKQLAIAPVLLLAASITAAQGQAQHIATVTEDAATSPLKLSIVMDQSGSVPAVVVTVTNSGDRDWILPIGFTLPGRTHLANFKILLTTSGSKPATVLYRRVAGTAGRADPSFTTLVRHSTYTFRLPTDDYAVSETNQLVSELAGSGATLRVRYEASEHNCPRTIDGRNPVLLSCWTEVLTSNAVSY
jgi:hypothetical protein